AQMKHWELAPTNPAQLVKAGIPVAFTMAGLKNKGDFWANLRKAIQYGLSETEALKALTYTPAKLVKAEKMLGNLQKGAVANFIVASGNIFQNEATLHENYIQGYRHVLQPIIEKDVRGVYDLSIGTPQVMYQLTLKGKPESISAEIERASDSLKVTPKLTIQGDLITLSFNPTPKKPEAGEMRLSGWANGKNWQGIGESAQGQKLNWQASYRNVMAKDTTKPTPAKPVAEVGKVVYPFEAFGKEDLPTTKTYLIQNATVWTNEKEGILQETDVLVSNGKIAKIGKGLPTAGAEVIDGKGKHLTAGIIDEHSHIALYSINDNQNVSSEVRMIDVLDSEDIDIYRQLSGGVTSAQLLHGSANCIGGQSAIIKLKWGESPNKMLVPNAPQFIKFALGENPKNGNSGFGNTQRYPQTRMGVEQAIEDAFVRAREYLEKKKIGGANFRKDLELEAVGEILEGKRFITCHSYVQSEINMLMKLAERHKFKVNTFTHILEGYKVGDKMKAHGAGASSFADWWAYKFEVQDAIPHNAAILTRLGVTTAINSDDPEMARRLNQEAAKTVKYGGLSEEEAWKTVTLNPAKLLHLDDKMGSVKVGKDADLVLWTANPLSIYAVVQMNMIDGAVYFERVQDEQAQAKLREERARLIQKMIQSKSSGAPSQKPSFNKPRKWNCCADEGTRLQEQE
ncbi:MAG: amidohydrolase, partial [Bacteroidetes bacterium]